MNNRVFKEIVSLIVFRAILEGFLQSWNISWKQFEFNVAIILWIQYISWLKISNDSFLKIRSDELVKVGKTSWKQNFGIMIHPINWLFFIEVFLSNNIIIKKHNRTKIHYVVGLIHKWKDLCVEFYKWPINCQNTLIIFIRIFYFYHIINILRILFVI